METLLNSIVKILIIPTQPNIYYPYMTINESQSTGTGIAIYKKNDNIYILTCAHVIENATKIFITTRHNKEKALATVVGISFDKDIAIIKMFINKENEKNLEHLTIIETLGDIWDNNINITTETKQGDILRAIGYPLAEDNPILTSGVFSGYKKNYLQVDTPVNPGNSGGPLINTENKIIGIVSSKLPNSVASNVAYGIPIEHINNIKTDILALEFAEQKIIYEPKMGLIFLTIDKNIYHYLQYNINDGYYVKKILQTSPFFNKIQPQTLILKINSLTVDRYGFIKTKNNSDNYKTHITDYVAKKKTGDKIILSCLYKNELFDVQMICQNINIYNVNINYHPYTKLDYEIFGGMVFMNLLFNHIVNDNNFTSKNNYYLTKYVQTEFRDEQIIIISGIMQGSYVSELKIFNDGEIITHVNDKPINSLCSLRKAILLSDKYVKFTSITGDFIVVDINECMQNEPNLSHIHKYKPSKITKLLLQKLII